MIIRERKRCFRRYRNEVIVVSGVILLTAGYIVSSVKELFYPLSFYDEVKSTTDFTTMTNVRKHKLFHSSLTAEEKKQFQRLMTTFSKVVPENVTYMLYGGTLLGSYRHHGMIPWDDDLDLLVRDQDKQILLERLSSLADYEINTGNRRLWKFFHRSSKRTRFSWRWPFLDIFFYLEDTTSIWDSHPSWRYNKYLKEDVFPLVRRPFMALMIPAPRNTEYVLSNLYDLDICETKVYDHKHDRFMGKSLVVQLPCVELMGEFPFVRREVSGNKITEILEYRSDISGSTVQPLNIFTHIKYY